MHSFELYMLPWESVNSMLISKIHSFKNLESLTIINPLGVEVMKYLLQNAPKRWNRKLKHERIFFRHQNMKMYWLQNSCQHQYSVFSGWVSDI